MCRNSAIGMEVLNCNSGSIGVDCTKLTVKSGHIAIESNVF